MPRSNNTTRTRRSYILKKCVSFLFISTATLYVLIQLRLVKQVHNNNNNNKRHSTNNNNNSNNNSPTHHACDGYNGILHIASGDVGGAAATIFFQFVIAQLIYAEMYNLKPWIHMNTISHYVYDPIVHNNAASTTTLSHDDSYTMLHHYFNISYQQDGRLRRAKYPGPLVVTNNNNNNNKITLNKFVQETDGIWHHYFQPVSDFRIGDESCRDKPYVTMDIWLITPGLHIYAPWVPRIWRYDVLPDYMKQRHLPLNEWLYPQRKLASDMTQKYIHIQPFITNMAIQALYPQQSQEEQSQSQSQHHCIGIHVRWTDKGGGRRKISVDEFLPFVKVFTKHGGRCVYIATDSDLVLQHIQTHWPAPIQSLVRSQDQLLSKDNKNKKKIMVRSNNETPVFVKAYHSHHLTNVQVLVDIVALSKCSILLHGLSAVSDAAMYLNPTLITHSVNLEQLSKIMKLEEEKEKKANNNNSSSYHTIKDTRSILEEQQIIIPKKPHYSNNNVYNQFYLNQNNDDDDDIMSLQDFETMVQKILNKQKQQQQQQEDHDLPKRWWEHQHQPNNENQQQQQPLHQQQQHSQNYYCRANHNNSYYKGILHIHYKGEHSAGMTFFHHILNQLIYADTYQLKPWIHLDHHAWTVYDDLVHNNNNNESHNDSSSSSWKEYPLQTTSSIQIMTKDDDGQSSSSYPGSPVLFQTTRDNSMKNYETKMFRFSSGNGVWETYFQPVSDFHPQKVRNTGGVLDGDNTNNDDNCPFVQLDNKLISEGIHLWAPWSVKAYPYIKSHMKNQFSSSSLSSLKDWYKPMRIQAHAIIQKYYHFQPYILDRVNEIFKSTNMMKNNKNQQPTSCDTTTTKTSCCCRCLAVHIRHGDKAGYGVGRKDIPLKKFLPFIATFLNNTRSSHNNDELYEYHHVYLATDSWKVIDQIQNKWPLYIQKRILTQGKYTIRSVRWVPTHQMDMNITMAKEQIIIAANNNRIIIDSSSSGSTSTTIINDNNVTVYNNGATTRTSKNKNMMNHNNHRVNSETLVDILAMSKCQFLIHGYSTVSEAAIYMNLNLHENSINLDDPNHINIKTFEQLLQEQHYSFFQS